MRFGPQFRVMHAAQDPQPEPPPAPVPPPPPTDAAGHVFDPARYRVNPDGTPMLTAAGTFRLRPGKKHA